MSFPPVSAATNDKALSLLGNAAAAQGLTAGLSPLSQLAEAVAAILNEAPRATVTPAALGTVLSGTADGLGMLKVARATFNPSANASERTAAPHGLGVTIPDKAVVVGGFIQINTTFTSADDSATVAIHVQSANDIKSAIAISDVSNPWDAGLKAIIPKANTPESTGIALTAAREITATVATQVLTAGKATIFIYYVGGA